MTQGRGPLLSVVMPAYNERATIAAIVEKVLAALISKEVIVVDDGSTDGTRDIVARLAETHAHDGLRVLLASRNQGKARRCVAASRRRAASTSSSRTLTWNTTRARIRGCCGRASSRASTWCMAHGSWVARSGGCCCSGTRSATGC